METTRKRMDSADNGVSKHLIALLTEAEAHITLATAVKGVPVGKAGVRPAGSPHSAWELLEHIRIAQEDTLRFSEGPDRYVALKWPDDYWPGSPAPKDASEWTKSVKAVEDDLAKFVHLLSDPSRNLLEPFAWGEGQTLMRESLLIADHNAYHVGELLRVRKLI